MLKIGIPQEDRAYSTFTQAVTSFISRLSSAAWHFKCYLCMPNGNTCVPSVSVSIYRCLSQKIYQLSIHHCKTLVANKKKATSIFTSSCSFVTFTAPTDCLWEKSVLKFFFAIAAVQQLSIFYVLSLVHNIMWKLSTFRNSTFGTLTPTK